MSTGKYQPIQCVNGFAQRLAMTEGQKSTLKRSIIRLFVFQNTPMQLENTEPINIIVHQIEAVSLTGI